MIQKNNIFIILVDLGKALKKLRTGPYTGGGVEFLICVSLSRFPDPAK